MHMMAIRQVKFKCDEFPHAVSMWSVTLSCTIFFTKKCGGGNTPWKDLANSHPWEMNVESDGKSAETRRAHRSTRTWTWTSTAWVCVIWDEQGVAAKPRLHDCKTCTVSVARAKGKWFLSREVFLTLTRFITPRVHKNKSMQHHTTRDVIRWGRNAVAKIGSSFECLLGGGVIPVDWMDGIVVPLHKGGGGGIVVILEIIGK